VHGFGRGVDAAGVLTKQWIRFVEWVHRRQVKFFLIAVAAVALVTLFGL
jgi:hypothetical protein